MLYQSLSTREVSKIKLSNGIIYWGWQSNHSHFVTHAHKHHSTGCTRELGALQVKPSHVYKTHFQERSKMKFPFATERNFHLCLSDWKPGTQCQVPCEFSKYWPRTMKHYEVWFSSYFSPGNGPTAPCPVPQTWLSPQFESLVPNWLCNTYKGSKR